MEKNPEQQGWVGVHTEPIAVKEFLPKKYLDALFDGDLKEEKTAIPGEENAHFTVIYGLKEEGIPGAAVKAISMLPGKVQIDDIEVFEKDEYNIVVALLKKSKKLLKLRDDVMQEPHYEQEFSDYKPHITLCYLDKSVDPNELKNTFSFLKGKELSTISVEVDNPFVKRNTSED